jgi:hypothetical protein
MGAGQAVSSHLRGRLVTPVQELLGTEHMAGMGNPVHAVQDIDLAEGRLHGLTCFSPGSAHPCSAHLHLLTMALHGLLLLHPLPGPPCCNFPAHPPVHPDSLPGAGGYGRKESLGTSTMNSLLE